MGQQPRSTITAPQNLWSALGALSHTLTLQVVMVSACARLGRGQGAMRCGSQCLWAQPFLSSHLAALGLWAYHSAKASAAFLGDEANHPSHTVMDMRE